jgi:hypothetical protein
LARINGPAGISKINIGVLFTRALLKNPPQTVGAWGAGPQYVLDNLKKERKMRSILRLSDALLGVKWAF